jgi:hypothetical protein
VRPSLAAALLAAACGGPTAAPTTPAPATIAGTDLEDTPETRAIALVIERYRVALKAGDVETLLALASPHYHDDAGTPATDDDIDRAALRGAIAHRLEVHIVDLQLRCRRVEHRGARVVVEADESLEIEIAGRRSRSTETVEIVLEPAGGSYLFLSGM